MKGTVNWYDEKEGKGYIIGSDGTEVFVYRSALDFLTILHPGDTVEYDIADSPKGEQAVDLKVLDSLISCPEFPSFNHR